VDNDEYLIHADDVSIGRRKRNLRTVAEKLPIVQLTMESGVSVAKIARTHEANANPGIQVASAV
jgi:hypothetical protein